MIHPSCICMSVIRRSPRRRSRRAVGAHRHQAHRRRRGSAPPRSWCCAPCTYIHTFVCISDLKIASSTNFVFMYACVCRSLVRYTADLADGLFDGLAARGSSDTDSRSNSSSVGGDGSSSASTSASAASAAVTRRRGFSRLKVFGAMKVRPYIPWIRVVVLLRVGREMVRG